MQNYFSCILGHTEKSKMATTLLTAAFKTLGMVGIDGFEIYLVQKETQCFYFLVLGLKILISKIVLFQRVCLAIKTLIA